MASLGRTVRDVGGPTRACRLLNRPSVWSLVLCATAGVLSGCHGDIAPADRVAGKALRQVGARLDLDDSGHVTEVILSNTPTRDESLRHLTGLHSVRSLQLENTGITDAGLQTVEDLDPLENLSLFGTHVTSAGVEYLRGLTALSKFHLGVATVARPWEFRTMGSAATPIPRLDRALAAQTTP